MDHVPPWQLSPLLYASAVTCVAEINTRARRQRRSRPAPRLASMPPSPALRVLLDLEARQAEQSVTDPCALAGLEANGFQGPTAGRAGWRGYPLYAMTTGPLARPVIVIVIIGIAIVSSSGPSNATDLWR